MAAVAEGQAEAQNLMSLGVLVVRGEHILLARQTTQEPMLLVPLAEQGHLVNTVAATEEAAAVVVLLKGIRAEQEGRQVVVAVAVAPTKAEVEEQVEQGL